MKRFAIAAKFLVIVIALAIILGCSIYKYAIGPVSSDSGKIDIIVSKGSTWYSLANVLKTNNLIKSESFYKFYVKLFKPEELQAGKYSLSPNMGVEKIVKLMEKGSTYNENSVIITIPEGKNMRAIANIIANKTANSYNDVMALIENKTYIDKLISDYWFITEDVKNAKIYYSIEGYLYPDTYEVDKTSNVEAIFKLMLDKMNIELTRIKEDLEKSSLKTVHKVLTLASIVELEAGTNGDRKDVAGVFFNRLNNNWTLGSDVTGYYGAKMDDWSNGLGGHLNDCNGYNTRGSCVSGLPVGPICSPSLESIKSVLTPTATTMFYFVADCDGKTYLTKTETEHNKIISDLKKNNKWCDQ